MPEKEFELKNEINSFHDSLELLRDFIRLIDTYLNEKTSETISEHSTELGIMFVGGIKTGQISKTVLEMEDGDHVDDDFIEKAHRKLESKLNTKITFEKVEKDEKNYFGWKFEDEKKDNISEALIKISKAQQRNNLLYNSALMSLASSVELLFSKIFHKYYECFPNAIEDKDKTFSYEEIKKYETLNELKELHISTKIQAIIHNSFLDWVKELRDKRKVSMSFLDSELDILVETFLRRNLIVHNSGIVNSIYLANVSPSLANNISLGDKLEPNLSYLEERIDALEKNCILIAAACWKHFTKKDNNRSRILNNINYNHLLSKKWAIAESLSIFIKDDENSLSTHQTIGKLNYWLCKKRQNKWNEIEKEVKAADFSDKGFLPRLGLLALEENYDEFFSIVDKAIQVEDITLENLNEFPVFEEMRADSRFNKYLQDAIEE